MNSKDISITKKNDLNQTISKNKLENIKSDYFLEKVSNNLSKKKFLEVIKYNKKLQQRLKININNYKKFSEIFSSIELELILDENRKGNFIRINEEDKSYYNIYFNNNKKEIKRTELNEDDKVSKINIIIEYQVKSFENLFYTCDCIESINFKTFSRNNIINMSGMFYGCSSLKKLNLSNFNTINVRNMSYMFYDCSSLKEINLSNFNTINVTDMSCMFFGCISLKEINLSNFNTNNVINMDLIFNKCSSLKELNLSNFNTNNVTNMSYMFGECSSLKEINLSNFTINNNTDMSYMFDLCSNELKNIVRNQDKNFKKEAFDDYKDKNDDDKSNDHHYLNLSY